VASHAHDQSRGRELNGLAFSSTVHGRTGCAIGEVFGAILTSITIIGIERGEAGRYTG
jgi:hypothetical protein